VEQDQVMVQPFVRVDVWSLAEHDPVLTAYADAVAAMQAKPRHDPTSWAFQAAIHGTLSPSPRSAWNQCRHGSWYFASWHRMYLYYFERIVRAQVVANGGSARWALPYWNYDVAGHNALPRAFRHRLRADGSPNPLYVHDRNPGINAGAGLPASITSAAFALARPTFTGASQFGGGVTSPLGQFWSSTGRLEQTPHNDVHVAIGGLMGDPDTAAQDPIFWLHHANIDRLWWLWQKQHANPTRAKWTAQSFSFKDADGTDASLTGADVEKIVHQLHYTYDQGVVPTASPSREAKSVNVKWPAPWPERPHGFVSAPPADSDDPDSTRTLVGGTEEPTILTGETARAPVMIDERATESLRNDKRSAEHQHRAFLDVEDIEAERNPGVVYGVYVNLPADPSPEDLAQHHVGNVALFGVERARAPRGDEHGHGLRVSMEITDLLDRLSGEGKWQDGQRLDVVFRPITLDPPTDDDGDRQFMRSAHPDVPIRVGRVSVHFA
jgi:Common central domain of tyrosinase